MTYLVGWSVEGHSASGVGTDNSAPVAMLVPPDIVASVAVVIPWADQSWLAIHDSVSQERDDEWRAQWFPNADLSLEPLVKTLDGFGSVIRVRDVFRSQDFDGDLEVSPN